MKGLSKDDPEFRHLQSRQQAMKILVNAMSYGIFIELNPEDQKSEIIVYGQNQYASKNNYYEKHGAFFNPLIGVIITSCARLLLAMTEAKLHSLGANHAYMDTDSIFVPPAHAETIIEYVKPLNPYNVAVPLLKAEEEDVYFYGVSSKRLSSIGTRIIPMTLWIISYMALDI